MQPYLPRMPVLRHMTALSIRKNRGMIQLLFPVFPISLRNKVLYTGVDFRADRNRFAIIENDVNHHVLTIRERQKKVPDAGSGDAVGFCLRITVCTGGDRRDRKRTTAFFFRKGQNAAVTAFQIFSLPMVSVNIDRTDRMDDISAERYFKGICNNGRSHRTCADFG